MYARACARGTDSFESIMHPNSFEGVFQIDTVEGVHACACMRTVHAVDGLSQGEIILVDLTTDIYYQMTFDESPFY